jgi:hydrogenase maturation protease
MTTTHQVSGLLVIGYGSPLRGDDAAGYLTACELDGLAGVTCIATHQLTPDLAAPIAEAAEVMFVDAVETSAVACISNTDITKDVMPHALGSHGGSPEALLNLAERLYGHRPHASVIGIPALSFALGEPLSESTRNGIEAAKRVIREKAASYA